MLFYSPWFLNRAMLWSSFEFLPIFFIKSAISLPTMALKPIWLCDFMKTFSGGFRGARVARALPGCPNSFNFMQFLGKFGKIVCWRPPPWGVGAPLGKFWIHRWHWQKILVHDTLQGFNKAAMFSIRPYLLTLIETDYKWQTYIHFMNHFCQALKWYTIC